ncbi:PHO85 cyclin-1 [Entomophthora muscae]|uniref:PHO85 cyclin-1 n=1 Tax=Entomophthora muscae TaxID=34485 RepID=A0ACC2TWB0_9FUNG|nr:PHO85 cyclin-1 [Entomophthora muscae]
MVSHDGQPDYQPFPNYNSYVAELVAGTVYVPICSKPTRRIPEFLLYVDNLLADIRICRITAIIALIYCDRLRRHLPARAIGVQDTLHRVYTAALLLACKYTGDPFSHCDVARASSLFTLQDINRMEFEFLTMLDYDTWISADHLAQFLSENQDGLYSVLKFKDFDP